MEIQIQSAICEYLELKRYFFSRINNIPVYDSNRKAFRRMPKYTLKGFPDIIVMKKGEVIFLEVKTEKGRLSEAQKEFQKRCELKQLKYYVVRSLEDVIKIL